MKTMITRTLSALSLIIAMSAAPILTGCTDSFVGSQDGHNVGSQDGHNVGSQDGHNVGSQDGHNVGSQDGHN